MSAVEAAMPQSNSGPTEPAISNGVLQVTYAVGPSLQPKRSVVVMEGSCPKDQPLKQQQTHACMDRRLLLPLSIRFVPARNAGKKPGWACEGEIQRAVWHVVRREMDEEGWKGSMPSIIFDQDPLDPSKRDGCMDLVFSSGGIWLRMRARLSTIQLHNRAKSLGAWRYTAGPTKKKKSLDGSILPFDVLRLPVDSIDTKELLRSFNRMAMDAGVGTVIGFGSYKVTDGVDEPSHLRSDILRGYIKLDQLSMTLPFATLARSLPTHFVWQGLPYVMYFPGRDFHHEPKHSANYPDELKANTLDGAGTSSSASSSSLSTSTEASSSFADSSSNDNKRKRSGT